MVFLTSSVKTVPDTGTLEKNLPIELFPGNYELRVKYKDAVNLKGASQTQSIGRLIDKDILISKQ
jgi:hypothetical protein